MVLKPSKLKKSNLINIVYTIYNLLLFHIACVVKVVVNWISE